MELRALIATERYDTIKEFNVDRKAECGRLDLAHITKKKNKKKYKKKKLKQLSPVKYKIREGSPNGTRKTMEEEILKRRYVTGALVIMQLMSMRRQ